MPATDSPRLATPDELVTAAPITLPLTLKVMVRPASWTKLALMAGKLTIHKSCQSLPQI
jgi:hypothetical protein